MRPVDSRGAELVADYALPAEPAGTWSYAPDTVRPAFAPIADASPAEQSPDLLVPATVAPSPARKGPLVAVILHVDYQTGLVVVALAGTAAWFSKHHSEQAGIASPDPGGLSSVLGIGTSSTVQDTSDEFASSTSTSSEPSGVSGSSASSVAETTLSESPQSQTTTAVPASSDNAGSSTAVVPRGDGTFSPSTSVTRDGETVAVSAVTGTVQAGAAGFAVVAGAVTFAAPSLSITCTMQAQSVRCDAAPSGLGYPLPPADPSCSGTWGGAIQILTADAPGTWACGPASWTKPSTTVLEYGNALSTGSMTCASQQIGVTCLGPSGHGFRYSRRDGATFY